MGSILQFSARRPLLLIPALLLLTLLAALQLPQLRVSISAQGILQQNSPARELLRQTEQQFGRDDISIIYLGDPDLFSPDRLELIRSTVERIDALPFVDRSSSLFSVPQVQNRDNSLFSGPYFATLPTAPAQMEHIKREALDNPLANGSLIGRRGNALAINVYFQNPGDAGDFNDRALASVEQLLQPLNGQLEQVFLVGEPAVRHQLAERLRQDREQLLPLALLVLILALALGLRRPNAALVPLVTTGLSLVWTLGLMAALEIPLDLLTAVVPALIILFGSANAVHLLNEYMTGIRRDLACRDAIDFMARNQGLTLSLVFLAGYLGFLSFALNDGEVLLRFGLLTSTGLMFNFFITVIALPAMMSVMGESKVDCGVRHSDTQLMYRRWVMQLLRLVATRRIVGWFLITLTAALALAGASQLRIDNDPMALLESAAPIHAETQLVQRELSGYRSFSIVLDSGIEDTFVQRRYLSELRNIQNQLQAQGVFDTSLSLADVVAQADKVMNSRTGTHYRLPEQDETIRGYLGAIPYRDISRYVSEDFRQARILVRHSIDSSQQLNRALDDLQAFIDQEVDPVIKVQVTGESVLSSRSVNAAAEEGMLALLVFSAALWLVVSLLFLNARAGLVALLPVGLPLLVLFGIMGAGGIALNAASAPAIFIALGIGIVNTLHLMSRYHSGLKRYHNVSQALSRSLFEEALPIVANSLALAAAFGILAVSGFTPVAQLGVLGAAAVLAAMLSTFMLTPLLLGSAELLTVWEMLSLRLRKDSLQRSPLFRGLGNWQIKKVILTGEIRSIARETTLEPDDLDQGQVFVLLKGQAEYRGRQPDDSTEVLNTWNVGDTLAGHMLQPQPNRDARAIALEDLQVLVFGWQPIDRISKAFPSLALLLYRNLAQVLGPRLDQVERIPDQFYLGDPTGLYGREFLAGRMEQEIRRSVRFRTPLSFISLQIGIDRAGSIQPLAEAPDSLFQRVIEVIEGLIRDVDMVARWNQGNPAILLPNTTIEQARELARRIVRSLRDEFNGQDWQMEISTRCTRLDQLDSGTGSQMLPTVPGA